MTDQQIFKEQAETFVTTHSVEIALDILTTICQSLAKENEEFAVTADAYRKQARAIEYAATQANRRGL
jgi:hypothetical protein